MEYTEQPYIVYIQTDEAGRITAVNSSAFVGEDWGTEIDQGYGDKYHHAQGNYFPRPIYTEDGIPRYKLTDGQTVERTQEEIAADRAARPEPEPTLQEQMGAAVRLAKAAAQNLTDVQALEVPELYERYGLRPAVHRTAARRPAVPLPAGPHLPGRVGAGEYPRPVGGRGQERRRHLGEPHPRSPGHGVPVRTLLPGPGGQQNLPVLPHRGGTGRDRGPAVPPTRAGGTVF